MAVYTDVPDYAARLLPSAVSHAFTPISAPVHEIQPLIEALFDDVAALHTAPGPASSWGNLLVRDFAPTSQFDRLIELARAGVPLPDRVLCLARAGSGFHGARGRAWSALPGNLHVTLHLSPNRTVDRFETVFTALAAVSVAEAADSVAGLAGVARIKWVNDVLIGDAKIGGVLAYTHSRGPAVTGVVLGIGMNVESTPAVEATSYVRRAGCLREFAAEPGAVDAPFVLDALLAALQRNYALLLERGYREIMERYRARSAVLGADVTIRGDDAAADELVAAGRVVAIGDGLELHLRGRTEPVTRGRLALGWAPPARRPLS